MAMKISVTLAAGVTTSAGSLALTRCASTAASTNETEEIPELELYWYSVCPWCNKLKAYLDYHKLPYRLHEVNPMNKKEIKFSEYKKVPIMIMEGQQINDSADIIAKLGEAMTGNPRYRATAIGDNSAEGGVVPEKVREMSEWAGKTLVPALTCSIYRSPSESLQAMQYIISHPEFSWFEKQLNQYVGGALMYTIVHMRMKKKYNIGDERQSVYQAISTFLAEVGDRKFLGGSQPCRTDLEVFGFLRAIQDMDTFSDTLKNTRVGPWYKSMEEAVGSSSNLT